MPPLKQVYLCIDAHTLRTEETAFQIWSHFSERKKCYSFLSAPSLFHYSYLSNSFTVHSSFKTFFLVFSLFMFALSFLFSLFLGGWIYRLTLFITFKHYRLEHQRNHYIVASWCSHLSQQCVMNEMDASTRKYGSFCLELNHFSFFFGSSPKFWIEQSHSLEWKRYLVSSRVNEGFSVSYWD